MGFLKNTGEAFTVWGKIQNNEIVTENMAFLFLGFNF